MRIHSEQSVKQRLSPSEVWVAVVVVSLRHSKPLGELLAFEEGWLIPGFLDLVPKNSCCWELIQHEKRMWLLATVPTFGLARAELSSMESR